MDRYNVVLGFLSDELPKVDQWVGAAPGRFIPSPMVGYPSNVDLGVVDLDVIRSRLKAGTLRGIGEISTQYTGIAANDPRLDPLFALAEEFDVPVLIHSAGTAGPSSKFRIALGHPELLEEVLLKHPRLRLYIENAGFPFLEEITALLYRYPNVYVDVSTITWLIPRSMFHKYLQGLIDAGLAKRVMFGSDAMEWPETIGLAIDAIDSASFLTAEQKRDIFYNNAARFLRLERP
jgi:uncharacterized protein